MAGANSIRAGRAHVETGVDNNPLSAGLRAASAKLKAFGSSLQAVGSSMLGVGISAAVPFALATQSFATFESAMARVKALTNASEGDFASLSAEAQRLGATTVYSASEAAKAMGVFALAGYKTHDIIKATGPALQLAAAGQMDLAQAADISMKVMSGMGIATEDLGGTIDVLAKAMTTANTDLIMLGEAFKYVGPVARSAGMSLEETTAAIQVLSDAGIQADMAGTTLRGAILSLTSPSEEARKALKKMGVEVMDAKGDFRGLTAIIADMEEALKGVGSGERLQLIGDIFANRQATGIATLIDRGAGELRTKTADLGTAGQEGTSGRIAKTQLDTLYGAWKLLESAVEGVAITIGAELMPMLREMGATVVSGIGVFHEFVKANKEWIPVIAKTILAVGGIGAALVAVGGTAGVVGFAVSALASTVGAVGSALMAFASPIALVAVGVIAAGEAIYNMEGAGEALKIVLGGIAAVVIVQIAALAGLVEVAKWVGSTIVWSLGHAAKFMQETFPQATAAVVGVFRDMGENLTALWDGIASTFGKSWNGIVDAISNGEFEIAGKIAWKGMQVIWQQGVNWLRGVWRGFTGYFVEAFHQASYVLAHTVNSVWSGLESVWFESFNLIGTAWGYLMDFMRKSFVTAGASISGGLLGLQASIGAISAADAVKKMQENATQATKEKEAIDAERKVSNEKVEQQRGGIEKRRADAEGVLLDQQIAEARNRRAAAESAGAADAKRLAEAEAELADALTLVERVKAFKSGTWFGNYDSWFGEFADKAPTRQGLDAAAESAFGGSAAGGSAGTFDAAMLRYLGGTGNEDIMQKRQTEAAEKAAERLQRLIDIARDNGNTYT